MSGQLIVLHTDAGVRAWIRRIFRSGKEARSLLLAAITAKYLETVEISQAEDLIANAVVAPQLSRMDTHSRKSGTASYAREIDAAYEIATLLEGGRKKEYEIAVLAAATALGGAAGAVAALIAG